VTPDSQLERPLLAPGVRYRWDETREQHQLLFPEGLLVLNESGAAIVQLCDGRTTDEVISELENQVSDGNPADDVHPFLARLTEKGLLRDGNS
jgi:pyrroloquinoline quinone biosynthesis protein D